MDNEFFQKLFQRLLMFLCYIPGSANNLWLLSKVLLAGRNLRSALNHKSVT